MLLSASFGINDDQELVADYALRDGCPKSPFCLWASHGIALTDKSAFVSCFIDGTNTRIILRTLDNFGHVTKRVSSYIANIQPIDYISQPRSITHSSLIACYTRS